MFRNAKSLLISFLFFITIVISGCGRAQVLATSTPFLATQANPTAVPISPAATTAPGVGGGVPDTGPTLEATGTQISAPQDYGALKMANNCNLINSQDLAHLFPPHNEIVNEPPATGPVSHPPFSTAQAAGTEQKCLFFDFHQPGGNTGWMLQITYLVDTPDPAAAPAWNQAWETAKAQSGQPVSGLGDDAFTSGTNLYIKMGGVFITFQADDTHVDAKTASGAQQLIAYELQLAKAAIERVK